jgi:trans-2,3-dihydro-3-hydroxyanthranilate isomerase
MRAAEKISAELRWYREFNPFVLIMTEGFSVFTIKIWIHLMGKYQFMQVDAFTSAPLGGNPCAVLFDTENMGDDKMLAIAREMNLSETSFVRASDIADFGARYFTPASEIPLAGHPTIATVLALVESGRVRLTGEITEITLELKAGVIPVEIRSINNNVNRIVMSQLKPDFLSSYDADIVLPIFGLTRNDKIPDVPIQTVSTGTPQLMIPLRSLESLARAQMEFNAYNRFVRETDFSSPHLFCIQGATPEGDTYARHLSPPPDIYEDPFTGSATGGMGAYLWKYGLIENPRFTAQQGHWLDRPGQAEVEVVGPPENIETVKVGGEAVLILKGEFTL